MRIRALAASVALAAGFACGAIGIAVSATPPGALDRAGRALAGGWPAFALILTASCWWYVLVTFGIAALVFAAAVPAWRPRVLFSLVTTVVAWQGSDAIKNVFGRPRPPYWILHHETSASYPSGHAMFAVVFYGLWSYYIATSDVPQPLRGVISAGAGLWGVGVIWSRLALGAHYVTDLIGGVLFGVAMLGIAVAVTGEVPR